MRAGELDRRIDIGRYQLTRGPDNEPIETFVSSISVWAGWRRTTGNERLAAGMVSAQVSDVFTVRWTKRTARIDPKDIVRYAGRLYDIVEATEIGRREGLLIRAAARADVGA